MHGVAHPMHCTGKFVKNQIEWLDPIDPCQEKMKGADSAKVSSRCVLKDCTILTSGTRLSNGRVTNVGDRLENQQRVIQNVKIVLVQLQIIKGAKPSFEAL